ncbi:MAG: Spy/CpxP family protein refolding chaperone [Elusimicrobiota bacterium]
MKRSFSFLFAAMLLLTPALLRAQEEPDGQPPGEEEPEFLDDSFIEKLDKHLKLSDEQRSRIESAVKDSRPAIKTKHAEMKELRKKMETTGKEFRERMFDLKEKIRSTLTNEQKERFDDMRQHMKRRRMPPGMQGSGEGMPPERRMPGYRPQPGEEVPPGWKKGEPHFPPERWHEDPMKGKRPHPGEEEGPERRPRRPGGQGERGGAPD